MTNRSWIYRTDKNNHYRFLLGMQGYNMLAVVAANPSTASPKFPDRTMGRIQKIAAAHGFDGWLICNLWPERQTTPGDMKKRMSTTMHRENLAIIDAALKQYPVKAVWAAWGNIVEKRPYLKDCCKDILSLRESRKLPWVQLSPPTIQGHPRHPLYQPGNGKMIPFYTTRYLNRWGF